LLLIVGTVLLTFTGIAFALFDRPLGLGGSSLFLEAVLVAGAVFAAMGVRGLYRVHRTLLGNGPTSSRHRAAA
jgi:protein-S-isoprenylcysteine O-methyltransferase Ste14